jgi:hypothetical protein
VPSVTFVHLREFIHRSLAGEPVRAGTGDLGIGRPPIGWTGPGALGGAFVER